MRLPLSDVSAFRRSPVDLFMERAVDRDDPLVPLRLSFGRVFLATDPGLARKILKSEVHQIEKGRLVQKLRAVVGHSLFTKNGPDHQRSKDALHRHLQRNALSEKLEKMTAVVNGYVSTIVTNGVYDTGMSSALSLQLTTNAMFGSDVLTAADRHALVQSVRTLEAHIHDDMFRILPRFGGERRRSELALAQAWEAFEVVVARARRSPRRSQLLRALEEGGFGDREISQELFGLLIAGHHTTASAISWMVHHLAADPAIAEIIGAEADRLLDRLEQGDTGAFRKAPLSLAFVREILRLYPSAYWMSREVQADHDCGGHRLRRGDTIIISPYQLHRDPRYWDRPEALELDRDFTNPAYLPFGVGPRACIGMGMAWFQLQLVVMQLSSALRFTPTFELKDAVPIPSVTLHAPEMRFAVAVRSSRAYHAEAAA